MLSEEYDVKVTSLFSDTNLASLSTRPPPGLSLPNALARKLQITLASHAARKRSNLPSAQARAAPFYPIIVSAGGLLLAETKDRLHAWKSWGLSKAAYSWMLTSISVSLARARGRTFSRPP